MRAKVVLSMLTTLVVVAAVAASAMGGSSARPAVAFAMPKAGAMTSSRVTFQVRLTNFTIDAANVGKRNRANRGHLHFAMDGGKYDFARYSGANGRLAAQLGIAGKYSPAVTRTITYSRLPKGRHTITVFLVNNDHSNTGAKAKITFTVR